VGGGACAGIGGADHAGGSLIPLTGIGGPFGPDIKLGQSLALQDVMQAGGLFGRPVKLMVQGDQSAPEPGVRAAQQLIQLGKVPDPAQHDGL
jgi:branched-chain amino acid transport system substrate-binding protein